MEFAQSIRKALPDLHLMVTGGFRTRRGMEAAVSEGDCDMVGIARPATVFPQLPKDIILNPAVTDDDAVLRLEKVQAPWLLTKVAIKSVGAGWETVSLVVDYRPHCDARALARHRHGRANYCGIRVYRCITAS